MELDEEQQTRQRNQLIEGTHQGVCWNAYQQTIPIPVAPPTRISTHTLVWGHLNTKPWPPYTGAPDYEVILNFTSFLGGYMAGTAIRNFELISTLGIKRIRLQVGGQDVSEVTCFSGAILGESGTFWECPNAAGETHPMPILLYHDAILHILVDGEVGCGPPDCVVATFELCAQPTPNPEFLTMIRRVEILTAHGEAHTATPDMLRVPNLLERVEIYPRVPTTGARMVMAGVHFPMQPAPRGGYSLEFPQILQLTYIRTAEFQLDLPEESPHPFALEVRWTHRNLVKCRQDVLGSWFAY